jgi:bacterioferritin-associated ferredoxin
MITIRIVEEAARGARVIVCSCFALSDRLVRARAREGASLPDVLAETGAGSACGACRLAIARVHAGERGVPPPCRARLTATAA